MREQQGRQAAARAWAPGGGEVWVSFRLVREPCFRVGVQLGPSTRVRSDCRLAANVMRCEARPTPEQARDDERENEMEIDSDAPVITRDEILISAPIQTIWNIQTDVSALVATRR